MRWRCECPICKIVVHPILKAIIRTKEVKNVEEGGNKGTEIITTRKEAEQIDKYEGIDLGKVSRTPHATSTGAAIDVATQLPTNVVAATEIESIGGSSREEEQKQEGEKVSKTEVKIPSEILDKIKLLEDELAKVRDYVNANINDIKSALIEIKSSIEELSTPFTMKKEVKDRSIKHIDEGLRSESVSLDLKSLRDITLWLNKVLSMVGLSKLKKLIDSYVEAGILNETLGNALRSMALVVDSLRNENVRPEVQAQIITELLTLIKRGKV